MLVGFQKQILRVYISVCIFPPRSSLHLSPTVFILHTHTTRVSFNAESASIPSRHRGRTQAGMQMEPGLPGRWPFTGSFPRSPPSLPPSSWRPSFPPFYPKGLFPAHCLGWEVMRVLFISSVLSTKLTEAFSPSSRSYFLRKFLKIIVWRKIFRSLTAFELLLRCVLFGLAFCQVQSQKHERTGFSVQGYGTRATFLLFTTTSFRVLSGAPRY